MAIDLDSLIKRAFFGERVRNATESVERARQRFLKRTGTDGISFEAVAPTAPDEAWVRERLAQPLIYFCESEGRPPPACAGAFVSLFVGDRLSCIAASDALDWAAQQLRTSVDKLQQQYGTGEHETVQR
jgi:hypothetical protein